MVTALAEDAVGMLADGLAAERALYEELAATLRRERKILSAMSTDDLLRIASEKELILARIRAQAGTLEGPKRALAAALGFPHGTDRISLSRLIERLEEPARTQLRAARDRVIALSEEVSELNRMNDRLIHRSLAYLTQYLTFLHALTTGTAGYLMTGARSGLQHNGRLVALKG